MFYAKLNISCKHYEFIEFPLHYIINHIFTDATSYLNLPRPKVTILVIIRAIN